MRKIIEVENEMAQMRSLCESEQRNPTDREKQKAKKLLDEIDEIRTEEAATAIQPRSLTRAGTVGGGNVPGGKRVFKSFGEQLRCVATAAMPSGEVDPRLYELRAASGLSEGTPSDGGFLVQTDFSQEILGNIFDSNEVLKRITRYTVSSSANGIKIPACDETSRADGSRAGGVQGFWTAEAAEKEKSKPKFRQMELSLKKMVVLVYATDELLQDSQALGKFITEAARREINFKLTDGIINGTGAGQPLGILSSGCLVSVAKEAGQTKETVMAENIMKMYSRHHVTDPSKCVWLINRNVIPQLHQMAIGVGTAGVAVYQPMNGLAGLPYSTLYGIPVFPIEQCPTLGTVGDIMLCDLSQYIAIEKGGIEEAMSIHVLFTSDQSVYRFVCRFDGQPALASSITPYKGSDAISPFVALALRA